MAQYSKVHLNFSESQQIILKSATRNETGVTLRYYKILFYISYC